MQSHRVKGVNHGWPYFLRYGARTPNSKRLPVTPLTPVAPRHLKGATNFLGRFHFTIKVEGVMRDPGGFHGGGSVLPS